MSFSTVLFPAPIPPPMKRRTGLLSLCAIGTITSVHSESSALATPIAFISSTNVLNTLATFRFFKTLSNLCSLFQSKTKVRLLAIVEVIWRFTGVIFSWWNYRLKLFDIVCFFLDSLKSRILLEVIFRKWNRKTGLFFKFSLAGIRAHYSRLNFFSNSRDSSFLRK